MVALNGAALDPATRQAILDLVTPLIGAASGESVQSFLRRYPPLVMLPGTCLTVDPDAGTATILVDGDPPESPGAPATLVGPAPPAGSRCMVMFGPGGHLLCLGSYGEARLLLPNAADVSLTSSDHPLQVGEDDALNLAVDGNTIEARDGTKNPTGFATLQINPSGGRVELARYLTVDQIDGNLHGYIGNKAVFTQTNPTGFAFGAAVDGRAVVNCSGGRATEFFDSGATLLLAVQAFAGVTALTVPAGLPTGPGFPIGISTGNQIVVVSSSARFKTQVRPLDVDDMLARARRLRPVRYRYRDHDAVVPEARDALIQPRFGLIAEDVAAVAPEASLADAEGHPTALDSQALIAILVGAVQALADRVDEATLALANVIRRVDRGPDVIG